MQGGSEYENCQINRDIPTTNPVIKPQKAPFNKYTNYLINNIKI